MVLTVTGSEWFLLLRVHSCNISHRSVAFVSVVTQHSLVIHRFEASYSHLKAKVAVVQLYFEIVKQNKTAELLRILNMQKSGTSL